MLHPQLVTFLQVVEEGSFSRAAARLFCSTVSVMNQMNHLEERVGVKLLNRSSQGVTLTEQGQSFCEDARKLQKLADRALKNVRRDGAGQLPTINLGNSFLRPCKPLLDILNSHPDIWTELFQIRIIAFNDDAEDFSRLRSRLGEDVDCFVSPCDCTEWINSFGICQLGSYPCAVSVPTDHRLAVKSALTWEDMSGESLLLVPAGISPVIDRLRGEIEEFHKDITIQDAPGYYDVGTFNCCVQNGYLMETPQIWSGIYPGIVTRPVSWSYRLPYGVIYSRNPSAVFEDFLELLENCL